MAIDQLLDALQRQAAATADQIRADAQAEVIRLEGAANETLAARQAGALTQRSAALRAATERSVGDAVRDARRRTLLAREALRTRVATALRAALPAAVTREDYRTLIRTRVAAALECAGAGPAVIRCTPALRPLIEAALAGHDAVVVDADSSVGIGFRLVAADGTLEIDDTLETRMLATLDDLTRNALQRLPECR